MERQRTPSPRIETRPLDAGSEAAGALIRELDLYQSSLYPPESNHLDSVEELTRPHVRFLGAYDADTLLGCGAVKLMDGGYAEIKRMYVRVHARGRGVGRALLLALEALAAAAGRNVVRLETGVKQAAAIELYRRTGYVEIGPFGDYREDPLSIFMEKQLAERGGGTHARDARGDA